MMIWKNHFEENCVFTCSCNIFLIMKDIYKENFALSCFSEYFFYSSHHCKSGAKDKMFKKAWSCDTENTLGSWRRGGEVGTGLLCATGSRPQRRGEFLFFFFFPKMYLLLFFYYLQTGTKSDKGIMHSDSKPLYQTDMYTKQ